MLISILTSLCLHRTFVHDALVQCGTMECFRVLNTAIIAGEISKPVADFVMYTMALRDYPELTLIEETLRVAFYNRTQSTFLPLGIMINRYWNNNPAVRNERRVSVEQSLKVGKQDNLVDKKALGPRNQLFKCSIVHACFQWQTLALDLNLI